MSKDNFRFAGNGDQGSFTPFQLFAGECELITDEGQLVAGVTFDQYSIIARVTASGLITPYDPTANTGAQIPIGITAWAVTTASTLNDPISYYVGGYFNHLVLTWPASVNTLALRKAAFERTPIKIGALI